MVLSLSKKHHLKMEIESNLRNIVFWKINRTVFLDKDRTMENVQKRNIYTNIPSSENFRAYYVDEFGVSDCRF
jgi:hypothetical protein